MWADTLLDAERVYAVRMLAWAALSVVAATGLLAFLAGRRLTLPVLKHFALQVGFWGLVAGVVAGLQWRALQLRDVAGATRLDRLMWFRLGLDVGLIGAGAVLVGSSRALGRSLAGMGAGAGLAFQGAALLLIDLQLVAAIAR